MSGFKSLSLGLFFMSPFIGKFKKSSFISLRSIYSSGRGYIWVVFKEVKNSVRRVGKGNTIQALIYKCLPEK